MILGYNQTLSLYFLPGGHSMWSAEPQALHTSLACLPCAAPPDTINRLSGHALGFSYVCFWVSCQFFFIPLTSTSGSILDSLLFSLLTTSTPAWSHPAASPREHLYPGATAQLSPKHSLSICLAPMGMSNLACWHRASHHCPTTTVNNPFHLKKEGIISAHSI